MSVTLFFGSHVRLCFGGAGARQYLLLVRDEMTVSHKHLGEFSSSLKQYLKSVAGERDCFQCVPPADAPWGAGGSGGLGGCPAALAARGTPPSEGLRAKQPGFGVGGWGSGGVVMLSYQNSFAWTRGGAPPSWAAGAEVTPRCPPYGGGGPVAAEAKAGGRPHGSGLTPLPAPASVTAVKLPDGVTFIVYEFWETEEDWKR